MKESNIYNIVKNAISILALNSNLALFLLSGIFFASIIAFFYGLFTIPVPGGALGFYRMEPPTIFEYSYLLFSAIVSALIVTITIHAAKIKVEGSLRGKKTSVLGFVTGMFGAICPACLGINFLAFGNVFTTQLAFLIPYIFWIQIGGILLLSIGLYMIAKSAYNKHCISCLNIHNDSLDTHKKVNKSSSLFQKISPFILSLVFVLLIYQVITAFGGVGARPDLTPGNVLITETGEEINIDSVIETVTPVAGFKTNVRWGDVVSRMIESGALDPKKLEDILVKRYRQEMKPEWIDVLSGKDSVLSIDNDNAVFMMYVLWALAKHNQNQILTDSSISKYFTNYDIGVGRVGYNDTPLLALTDEQQRIAKKVSENAYRPCCGNSTAVPDCSHGYSALGLIQLMATQGFSEKEIFDVFVQFNSFWFPETYIKTALYFEASEGIKWEDLDKELIAGKEYSTLRGSFKAKNYLKQNFGI